MKHISLFAVFIGVSLLLLSLPATDLTGAYPAPTSTMTPVATRFPLSSGAHGSPLDNWFSRRAETPSKPGTISPGRTSQLGDLLYEDDFSDPNSGWPTGDDEDGTLEYLRGEYRIRIKKADWYTGVTPGESFTDFALEADARFASAVEGAGALLFGISDEWDWYGFWVSSDGYYAVYKHIDETNDWQPLQDWTYSSFINQGQESNRLRVTRDGAQIAVYINDEHLSTVTDSTFTGSLRVGLAAETFDQAGVDARFDNLRVYSLETSPEASPSPTASNTPSQALTATPTTSLTGTPTTATPVPCPSTFNTGRWEGFADFTVPSDRTRVEDLEMEIECGSRRWQITGELPIINGCQIAFSREEDGANIWARGTFISETEMEGSNGAFTGTNLCSGTWRSWWVPGTALETPTSTPTVTPSPTATPTYTPTATASPTPGTKVFLPLVVKNWPPMPTPTATSTCTPTATPTEVPTLTPTVTPTPEPGIKLYVRGCRDDERLLSTTKGGGVGTCFYQPGAAPEWPTTLTGDISGDSYSFFLCLANKDPFMSLANGKPPINFTAEIILRQDNVETVLASTSFEVAESSLCNWHTATVQGVDPTSEVGDTLSLRLQHGGPGWGGITIGAIDSQIRIPPVE